MQKFFVRTFFDYLFLQLEKTAQNKLLQKRIVKNLRAK